MPDSRQHDTLHNQNSLLQSGTGVRLACSAPQMQCCEQAAQTRVEEANGLGITDSSETHSDKQTGLLGCTGGGATSSIMVCRAPGDSPSRVARAVRAALAAAVAAGSVSRVAAKAGSSRCLSHSAPHETSMVFPSLCNLCKRCPVSSAG